MHRDNELNNKTRSGLSVMALAVVAFAVVGCAGDSEGPLQPPTVNLQKKPFQPNVDAGWSVQPGDLTLVAELKKRTTGNHGQSFAMRNDPFALLAEEKAFERSQTTERVLADAGSWRFDYEEPVPVDDTPIPDPQPYRRLAGIIVGQSVLALIDMGDGRPLEIIRPGQRIPNSEWTVVSIDEEKAILRRPGRRLPREIVVRLESPPSIPGQIGGGGRPNNPGGPPGGGPDMPGFGPPGGEK